MLPHLDVVLKRHFVGYSMLLFCHGQHFAIITDMLFGVL